MLSQSIRRQTLPIFENIEILFDSFSADEFAMTSGGFPIWKQFYHLIHSIDKNFIDPSRFTEPDFHQDNLDIVYFKSDTILSKEQITNYYCHVKLRVKEYLATLTDEQLNESIEYHELKITKLDLILAQLRHIFYHVGYLHCIKKVETGETPNYVGLYQSVVR